MKKNFKTAMLAVAVIAAGYGGVKSINYCSSKSNTILDENVEAYTQLYLYLPVETSSDYQVTHFPCYGYGSLGLYVNGYSASCWHSPGCSNVYHSHSCNSCSGN